MDFTDKQIRPPKSWEKFEDLCHDLFKLIWADPLARKNGRRGQPQNGVDIYTSAQGANSQGWRGVQCKGKEQGYSAHLTLAEFTDELAKAETFEPSLTHWTLATSGPKDAALERDVRKLSEVRVSEGKFPVDILAWEDLQSHIGDHDQVLRKHYREHLPFAAQAEASMEAVAEKLTAITGALQTAARPFTASLDEQNSLSEAKADAALHARIDAARDWIRRGRPSMAVEALEVVESQFWSEAGEWARFRILTNKGAALLNLGDTEKGAALLIEAYGHAPNDQKAGSNFALAHFLRSDFEQAQNIAWSVVQKHPDSSEAFAIWIRASEYDSAITDPLSNAPAGLNITPSVSVALAHWQRSRDQFDESILTLRNGVAEYPNDELLAAELATGLLEVVERDRCGEERREPTPSQLDLLQEAIGLLQGYVSKHSASEISEMVLAYTINLACALRVTGDVGEADKVVNDLASRAPEDGRVREEQARLCMVRGDFAGAVEASGWPSTPSVSLLRLRAEALSALERHRDALSAIEAAIAAAVDDEEISLRAELPRFLWQAEQQEAAWATAIEFEREYPSLPEAKIALSDVSLHKGDLEAAISYAMAALSLVSTQDQAKKLVIAECLFEARDFEGAIHLLRGREDRTRDNPILRKLIQALMAADCRREAHELLNALPREVGDLAPYQRAFAYLAERCGNLEQARNYLESYLALRPGDVHERLFWLEVLVRVEDWQALHSFLDSNPELVGGTPDQQMAYAHLLDQQGMGRAALKLGYKVLRDNYQFPRLHMGYAGLIIEGQSSGKALESPTEVAPDTAFVVKMEDGKRRTFVIEGEYLPDPSRGEISPTSALAIAAIRKRKRQTISMSINPVVEPGKIMEIKDKYLHMFHQTLERFNSMFPDETGFIGFSFDKRNPEKTLEKIKRISEPRSNHVRTVADAYAQSSLPLGFIARMIGVDPIDAWSGLLAQDQAIKVCSGLPADREQALLLLRKQRPLVMDPLTAWIAGVLNVLPKIEIAFGPPCLTRSSLEALMRHRDGLRRGAGREAMSMGVVDGALTRSVSSPEQTQGAYDQAVEIVGWLKRHATTVPALPKKDFSGNMRAVGAEMDVAFIDTIMAASGEDALLVTEDFAFRQLAQEARVRGVWIQPVLMEMERRGHLTSSEYDKACRQLAELRHTHTSIRAGVLMNALEVSDWGAETSLTRVLQSVANPATDLRSAFVVCAEFVQGLWSVRVPKRAREPAVRAVLDSFLVHHRKHAAAVADGIASNASKHLRKGFENRRHASELRRIVGQWKSDSGL